MGEQLRFPDAKDAAVRAHPEITGRIFGDGTDDCGRQTVPSGKRGDFAGAKHADSAAKRADPKRILIVTIEGPNGVVGEPVLMANGRETSVAIMSESAAV